MAAPREASSPAVSARFAHGLGVAIVALTQQYQLIIEASVLRLGCAQIQP
jgi:hypothetical protein